MKNLLIIYNVIFLFAGNIFFSNIHYLNHYSHHHSHDHSHDYKTEECLDCVVFESNNNCVSESNKVNFSNTDFNQYKIQHLNNNIKSDVEKIHLSRSPPNS